MRLGLFAQENMDSLKKMDVCMASLWTSQETPAACVSRALTQEE